MLSALRKSPSPLSGLIPISSGSGIRLPFLSPVVLEVDRLLGVVLAEQIALLALVAGRDQLLQAQLLEVVGRSSGRSC